MAQNGSPTGVAQGHSAVQLLDVSCQTQAPAAGTPTQLQAPLQPSGVGVVVVVLQSHVVVRPGVVVPHGGGAFWEVAQ